MTFRHDRSPSFAAAPAKRPAISASCPRRAQLVSSLHRRFVHRPDAGRAAEDEEQDQHAAAWFRTRSREPNRSRPRPADPPPIPPRASSPIRPPSVARHRADHHRLVPRGPALSGGASGLSKSSRAKGNLPSVIGLMRRLLQPLQPPSQPARNIGATPRAVKATGRRAKPAKSLKTMSFPR